MFSIPTVLQAVPRPRHAEGHLHVPGAVDRYAHAHTCCRLIGRIPGILVSTYAASGLVDGNVWQSIVILAVLAVVAVVCVIFREQLMGVVEKLGKKR